jgi:predicted membrane protein
MKEQKNLPFVILLLILVKAVFLPAALFDAVAITVSAILFGFKLYLDHIKKPDFSQEINDRLEKLNDDLNTKLEAQDREIKKLESWVSAQSLNSAATKKQSTGNYRW